MKYKYNPLTGEMDLVNATDPTPTTDNLKTINGESLKGEGDMQLVPKVTFADQSEMDAYPERFAYDGMIAWRADEQRMYVHFEPETPDTTAATDAHPSHWKPLDSGSVSTDDPALAEIARITNNMIDNLN